MTLSVKNPVAEKVQVTDGIVLDSCGEMYGIGLMNVKAVVGFFGNMWSSPVYDLAMDTGNDLGVKYNISFPWANVMQAMTVPQAFMVTFAFLFLYLVLVGFLLYVCNLLLKEIYGILIVFSIQISG